MLSMAGKVLGFACRIVCTDLVLIGGIDLRYYVPDCTFQCDRVAVQMLVLMALLEADTAYLPNHIKLLMNRAVLVL